MITQLRLATCLNTLFKSSARLKKSTNKDDRKYQYAGDGSIDIRGNPVSKNDTGNWKACPFILGTECCERLAYYGIASNLVSYLTRKIQIGNVSAAASVTLWQGTCYLTPMIGAVIADAYWGRYWTIAVFSTIYFAGMTLLTFSATVPSVDSLFCIGSFCPKASSLQYAVFYIGLYLVALGTGGIKPCVSSFGADQFDDTDPTERKNKGSFFNWFYFSINIGALISSSFLVWVQDNWGWSLGFGIPTIFMALAIGSFFSGTALYRFQKPRGSPITRICQVIIACLRKWKVTVPRDSSLLYELTENTNVNESNEKLEHTDELTFLDKAATISYDTKADSYLDPWILCTVTQVEELKILLRMFPIWATSIVFSAVYAQMSTMFVEQGMVLDTSIGSFRIPPASLSTFDVISVIIWVPIYNSFVVPIARKFTGKDKGFSELQRMGVGLFISIISMASAAVLETYRLGIARAGLVDKNVPVPVSIFWQIPQYFFIGAAEIFLYIGQLEFFYEQSPAGMKSLCTALALLTTAFGNYLSSFILASVKTITTKGGKPGWIPDNLNEGHLDYFFWLLGGFSLANLVIYVYCAMRYKSKKAPILE